MSQLQPVVAADLVIDVIDQLQDSAIGSVNWRQAIYSTIDRLRATSAPDVQRDTAERISIALLQLEWATQRGDAAAQEKAKEVVAAMSDAWRDMTTSTGTTEVVRCAEMTEASEPISSTEAIERILRRQ